MGNTTCFFAVLENVILGKIKRPVLQVFFTFTLGTLDAKALLVF